MASNPPLHSIFKKIIPTRARNWMRDLDSAYQARLKEIDSQNCQIAELQNYLQAKSTELENFAQVKSKEIELANQEIAAKEKRILEIESLLEEKIKEIDLAKERIAQLENSDINDEDYEHLSKAGLFIVGCARSGTSVLCDFLNISSDIYLLGEANFFLNYQQENFVEYFNNQHLKLFKNQRSKGKCIPPSRLPEKGGLAFLTRMKRNYALVGEKVAFGPHPLVSERSFQEIFFDFHATYFYWSKYILIIRRPTESIWSMKKMFSERSLSSMFECWLQTIKIQIDIFYSFPNAYVLLFENLFSVTNLGLSKFLGFDISAPKNVFRKEAQLSLLGRNEIPDELSQYSEICLDCEEIYQRLKNEFDPDPVNNCIEYFFTRTVSEQINKTLDKIYKIKFDNPNF